MIKKLEKRQLTEELKQRMYSLKFPCCENCENFYVMGECLISHKIVEPWWICEEFKI